MRFFFIGSYGRGGGLGRILGVMLGLAVGVGRGVGVGVGVVVAVAVALAVAVGVGDGACWPQYLAPVWVIWPPTSSPPQMIISLPVHIAV